VRKAFAVCVVAAGVFLPSAWVAASLFEPVSDLQLVCEATDIIRGQVTDVYASWDAEGQAIWTTATVQVQEVIRGSLSPDSVIEVKEVGGTVGDYTIKAEGFPTFRESEEVVLLLQPWEGEAGTYRVSGYGRGMFSIDRREGFPPAVSRDDVVESGRPTMHIDRIPARLLLTGLDRELRGLAQRCEGRERPQ